MGYYSIKELERLSGIKAHTIRIWEKRYQLIEPHRSDTNIRSYNDKQLIKTLNVASMIKLGYKISKISHMKEEEISEILSREFLSPAFNDSAKIVDVAIHELIKSSISFDELSIEDTLENAISKSSLEEVMTHIIFPALQRIGFLWRTNKITPAHEHFLSNKVKQTMYTHIGRLGFQNSMRGEHKYLLFLPEWEEHEILLLFCYYLLKSKGLTPIYLGCKIPLKTLIETIKDIDDCKLVTIFTSPNYELEAKKYYDEINKTTSKPHLIAGGIETYKSHLESLGNVSWIQNSSQFLSSISD